MPADEAFDRPTTEAVVFPSGRLDLEGILHRPAAPEALSPAVAVLQPHPLYGGDMHNNVVVALCEALAEQGFVALRFNFRGVGRSGGSHEGGVDEREDARAALDFLASRPGVDASRLCLAGYSFGAVVALSVGDERLAALAAVSPPLGRETLLNLTCPTLFVFGERDNIAPHRDPALIGSDLPEGSRVFVVPGADHFWLGFEDALAGEVGCFFLERIRGS